MKRIKFLSFLLALALFFSAGQLFSQEPPPLPPDDPSLGGDHKPVGDLPAGQSAAPIGSGTAILLMTALGYGIRKVVISRKKEF